MAAGAGERLGCAPGGATVLLFRSRGPRAFPGRAPAGRRRPTARGLAAVPGPGASEFSLARSDLAERAAPRCGAGPGEASPRAGPGFHLPPLSLAAGRPAPDAVRPGFPGASSCEAVSEPRGRRSGVFRACPPAGRRGPTARAPVALRRRGAPGVRLARSDLPEAEIHRRGVSRCQASPRDASCTGLIRRFPEKRPAPAAARQGLDRAPGGGAAWKSRRRRAPAGRRRGLRPQTCFDAPGDRGSAVRKIRDLHRLDPGLLREGPSPSAPGPGACEPLGGLRETPGEIVNLGCDLLNDSGKLLQGQQDDPHNTRVMAPRIRA